MFGATFTAVRGISARIEEGGARHGLAYPWWIPVTCAAGTVTLAIIALIQRDALVPPRLVVLAPAVIVVAFLLEFLSRKWMPWWMTASLLIGSVAWLMADASNVSRALDMAPAILAFLVAQITATDGPRLGTLVTAASIAVLAVFGLDDRVVHVLEILVGLMVGAMLRTQMRAVVAEREARTGERERATLAERQRIAREIHDLVGHSLSVTLLHVTGARRALDEDHDIDDAIAALTDAERIGREAMADIRRTVAVLATDHEDLRPLPTATDVEQLVEDVRAAGLEVEYDVDGDLGALPPAAGLGLYRVVQESLANVVKHAPATPAQVRMLVTSGQARVQVTNPLPSRSVRSPSGSGVAGMASRAEQLGGSLHAGRQDGRWLVDMSVPLDTPTTDVATTDPAAEDPACGLRRIVP